jgi:hypothetical protein
MKSSSAIRFIITNPRLWYFGTFRGATPCPQQNAAAGPKRVNFPGRALARHCDDQRDDAGGVAFGPSSGLLRYPACVWPGDLVCAEGMPGEGLCCFPTPTPPCRRFPDALPVVGGIHLFFSAMAMLFYFFVNPPSLRKTLEYVAQTGRELCAGYGQLCWCWAQVAAVWIAADVFPAEEHLRANRDFNVCAVCAVPPVAGTTLRLGSRERWLLLSFPSAGTL